MKHDATDLQSIFRQCFFASTNTLLVRGDQEPIYLPASDHRPHNELVFAHGFFASALHEISHWCIAGAARRKLVDFGYWYKPDGRNADEQTQFLQVESKPQALEWIFSDAARFSFHFSFDNLSGDSIDTTEFKERVKEQKHSYLTLGLPPRAEQFRVALTAFYQPSREFTVTNCFNRTI